MNIKQKDIVSRQYPFFIFIQSFNLLEYSFLCDSHCVGYYYKQALIAYKTMVSEFYFFNFLVNSK